MRHMVCLGLRGLKDGLFDLMEGGVKERLLCKILFLVNLWQKYFFCFSIHSLYNLSVCRLIQTCN